MMELYRADSNKRFRAFHDEPSKVFPDGTLLVFGAGKISMMADEWFKSDTVLEVFVAFLERRDLPEYVHWRDAPGL
jgi:hypothetical protein